MIVPNLQFLVAQPASASTPAITLQKDAHCSDISTSTVTNSTYNPATDDWDYSFSYAYLYELTYTFVATNTGDETLTGVTITDAGMAFSLYNWTCDQPTPATLAPGEKLICSAITPAG